MAIVRKMARKRIEIPDNVADLVGGTPMVRFTRLGADLGADVFGKLEAYNPAGSVKDRIGVAMIAAAEAEGRIEPGVTTVIEPTSGNTGIALAFVCAAKGYRCILTMPQGMSREREGLVRLYGAEAIVTESMGGMHEAVDEADAPRARDRELVRAAAVREPGQPGDAPAHDRRGDLDRPGRPASTCSSLPSAPAARSRASERC